MLVKGADAVYCPAPFREERTEVLHAAIAAHPLASLISQGGSGLCASVLPFVLARDHHARAVLRTHLARANPQVADLGTASDVLVLFQGAQAYISPAWYPTKREHGKAVPTWNYVMVEVRGRPRLIEDKQELRDLVTAITSQEEMRRIQEGGKDSWAVSDAPADYIDAMLAAIIGLEIPITRIEGKWKVSQNQPAINREGVIKGLLVHDPASAMAQIITESNTKR